MGILEGIREEYRQQAIREGLAEGRTEGLEQGRTEGEEIANRKNQAKIILKAIDLPLDKSMLIALLDIKEEELLSLVLQLVDLGYLEESIASKIKLT